MFREDHDRVGAARFFAVGQQQAHLREQFPLGKIERRTDPGSLQREEFETARQKHVTDAAHDAPAEFTFAVIQDPAVPRDRLRAAKQGRGCHALVVSYFCRD